MIASEEWGASLAGLVVGGIVALGLLALWCLRLRRSGAEPRTSLHAHGGAIDTRFRPCRMCGVTVLEHTPDAARACLARYGFEARTGGGGTYDAAS